MPAVAARNSQGFGIPGPRPEWLMSDPGVPFQPLIVFHAHVLHEFGAGLHARQRSCVLKRLLVILGIGDGYFTRHMILVDYLEALDHLQLFPMRVLRSIEVSHSVKSLRF